MQTTNPNAPRRILRCLCVAVLLQAISALAALGQELAKPVPLSSGNMLDIISQVRSFTNIGLSPGLKVTGQVVIRPPGLIVESLTLGVGSVLVLPKSPTAWIVARRINVITGEPAPIITWERSSHKQPPSVYGKAAPGPIGGAEGANGGAGTEGQAGAPGYAGLGGPTLYFMFEEIAGGQIKVDLRGEDGGAGGDGQTGGDGGVGRSGRNAVPGIIDCRSGGGSGGSGGPGGRGGMAGEGGLGGNGGTMIVLSTDTPLGLAAKAFLVDVSSGKGGLSGQPGAGGQGGPPGQGGSGAGLFCNGGPAGATGSPGPKGEGGSDGKPGREGTFGLAAMTGEQLTAVLGLPHSQ